jgi:anti-sigma regulatory factor (Ser/Thr protein kinase)
VNAVDSHARAFCNLAPRRGLTEPGHAREQARKALFGWGLGEHAYIVEVIVSEMVTNAIRHGTGPVRTRISCDNGHLRIEVHDDGPGRPLRCEAAADDESGRGLVMIDGLLDPFGGSRGVEDDPDGDGKTVYVSVRLAASQ